MAIDSAVGLLATFAVLVYLVIAMLRPEKF